MGLVPEKDGMLNAGLAGLFVSAAAGATVYWNVPALEEAKLKTNVPTFVAPNALAFHGWLKGVPRVTYMSPLYCVGEVQLPTGITIQSGLKLPGDAGSAARGSYVYHTASTWLSACCVNVMPHPLSPPGHAKLVPGVAELSQRSV